MNTPDTQDPNALVMIGVWTKELSYLADDLDDRQGRIDCAQARADRQQTPAQQGANARRIVELTRKRDVVAAEIERTRRKLAREEAVARGEPDPGPKATWVQKTYANDGAVRYVASPLPVWAEAGYVTEAEYDEARIYGRLQPRDPEEPSINDPYILAMLDDLGIGTPPPGRRRWPGGPERGKESDDMDIQPYNSSPGGGAPDVGASATATLAPPAPPPGKMKDASDFLAAGGTAAQLLALADAAPVWTSPAAAPSSPGPAAPAAAGGLVRLGDCDPATGRRVLSPRRTLPTAEAFVQEFYAHPDGRTLLSYANLLMEWRENRYVEIEDETLRQRLQPWLHGALRYVVNRRTGELELVDFESNPATVKAAADTLRNHVHLPASVTAPAWLDGDTSRPPASELLPCRSMILHLPTLTHIEPTPQLFVTNALDYDYDPNAPPPPRWHQFLNEVLPGDPESIRLLQTWCGYVLTGDTRLQKMLMLVGAKRSGKGTIARVLTRLIGPGNVCGPSTSSLAGPFGLQPLLGKSLAIVSDARFSGDHVPIVVERLLCISGEDTLTIDRKYLGAVTLRLPTRFMFLTNELPKLSESSGALAGRFLVLKFTQSFYGREDPFLTDKLLKERPGILKWAIEGWRQLQVDGRLIEPASSRAAVEELEDLLSPVAAFVRERCDVSPGNRVWVEDLYRAWREWCGLNGRDYPGTVQTFGRDLAAAVPSIQTRRHSKAGRFVEGIELATT